MDKTTVIIEFVKLLHNHLHKWIKLQRVKSDNATIGNSLTWRIFSEVMKHMKAKIKLKQYPTQFKLPSKHKVGHKQWMYIVSMQENNFKPIFVIPRLKHFILECQNLNRTNSCISRHLQSLFLQYPNLSHVIDAIDEQQITQYEDGHLFNKKPNDENSTRIVNNTTSPSNSSDVNVRLPLSMKTIIRKATHYLILSQPITMSKTIPTQYQRMKCYLHNCK